MELKSNTRMHRREIWKDIIGYEGLYQVSNYGRIKTVARDIVRRNGEPLHIKEIIRKAVVKSDGYVEVHLRKNGKGLSIKVHRLVAEAFIPNPYNLPQVNHIDEDKTNNNVSNLEWCTRDYNMHYGTGIDRAALKRKNGKKSKSVKQYFIDGKFIKEWPSVAEIERQTGYGSSNVSACCRGKFKTMYNYMWRYE